jgi:hypothetical protein
MPATSPSTTLGLSFGNHYAGSFISKKETFPSNGLQRKHYILVNRNFGAWLLGSTAITLNSLPYAQDVVKKIRAAEIGERYMKLCAIASDILEQTDPKNTGKLNSPNNVAPRTQAMSKLQSTDHFLGRRKDHGMAIDQDLEVDWNCFRCRATFGIIEIPECPQKEFDHDIQTYKWKASKAKHACAECTATLKSALVNIGAQVKPFE